MKNSKWIISPSFDLLWFIAPLYVPALLIFALPISFIDNQRTEIFPYSWIFIVLAVDVAHVYSTIYKTYFNPEGRKKHKKILIYLPILVWIVGFLVFTFGARFFWTIIAYLAVHHFIRQQFGFFKLLSPIKTIKTFEDKLLAFCVYSTMVIPILIWHCSGQRNFNWMSKGDFFYLNLPSVNLSLYFILVAVYITYFILELRVKKESSTFQLGRVLLTVGSGFSYFIAIVYTNNDFCFSFINVIGHGVPYLALVYASEKKTVNSNSSQFMKTIFSRWGWMLYYSILFSFAFFEESLWDVFVWHEQSGFFGMLYGLRTFSNPIFLAVLVPLLVMPQVMHYFLDGVIWKRDS